jgi:hypothetical protein
VADILRNIKKNLSGAPDKLRNIKKNLSGAPDKLRNIKKNLPRTAYGRNQQYGSGFDMPRFIVRNHGETAAYFIEP